MNIAERIVAGPPVLATVGRRAKQGDVVYLPEHETLAEVVMTGPAIVGHKGLVVRSLYDPSFEVLLPYREVVVLTKREAAEVRAHIAENWSA